MTCLKDDIRIWLLDRNLTTLSDAAKLSDEYTAVHKNHAGLLPKTSFTALTGHSNNNRYNSNRRYQGYRRSGRFGFHSTRGAYSSNDARTESAVGQDNVRYSQYNNQPQGCWFCGKRGHKKSQCSAFKAQNVSINHGHEESNINANNEALPRSHNHSTFTGLTVSPRSRRELIESVGNVCLTGKINLVDILYLPHMVEGHVYDSEGHKIKIFYNHWLAILMLTTLTLLKQITVMLIQM